jgi:hypothetical protein
MIGCCRLLGRLMIVSSLFHRLLYNIVEGQGLDKFCAIEGSKDVYTPLPTLVTLRPVRFCMADYELQGEPQELLEIVICHQREQDIVQVVQPVVGCTVSAS